MSALSRGSPPSPWILAPHILILFSTPFTMSHDLLHLLSQYDILVHTSKYLSTLDIFHLALANSSLHAIILQSTPVFNRLKFTALCDGTGLKARQEFQGPYELLPEDYLGETNSRRAVYDEEIEVRVWSRQCDAANALPCLKCGINVCEECRYVPRVRDTPNDRSTRRPHNNPTTKSRNVICYCTACDENVEAELPLSLSKYCDCDQYKRWICLGCKNKEDAASDLYYQKWTKGDWELDQDLADGMYLDDQVDFRAFWCPCGQRPPIDGEVRCAWCRKRHNQDTWMDENTHRIPAFDDVPRFLRVTFAPGRTFYRGD